MTVVRLTTEYIHQGNLLHPKLAYDLPCDVAQGMITMGLASIEDGNADVTMPLLTWDCAENHSFNLVPDGSTHGHKSASEQ